MVWPQADPRTGYGTPAASRSARPASRGREAVRTLGVSFSIEPLSRRSPVLWVHHSRGSPPQEKPQMPNEAGARGERTSRHELFAMKSRTYWLVFVFVGKGRRKAAQGWRGLVSTCLSLSPHRWQKTCRRLLGSVASRRVVTWLDSRDRVCTSDDVSRSLWICLRASTTLKKRRSYERRQPEIRGGYRSSH